MKKSFIFFLAILFLSLPAYSQKAQPLDSAFCKHYVGTIDGKYKIRMILYAYPNDDPKIKGLDLNGIYFYENKGIPLHLSGRIDPNGDFNLTERDLYDRETGKWVGSLSGEKISGSWQDIKSGNKLPLDLKEDYSESLQFKTFYLNEKHHFKDNPKNSFITMEYFYNHPSAFSISSVLDKIQSHLGKYFFEKNYLKNDLLESFKRMKAAEIKEFDEEADSNNTGSENNKENDGRFHWELSSRLKPFYNDHNILTLSHDFYEFTGGAHGNYGEGYNVYDLKTGNPITLNQIFKEKYEKKLTAQIVKYLRIYFKTTHDIELEDALMDGDPKAIQPNGNFFITKGGIGFHYNAYEIAPYALGGSDAFVPFSELKEILKEKSPIAHLFAN